MEAQLREALEAHDAARAERAELVAQREDARTQRDELLLAQRALQRSARTAGTPAPAPTAAPAGRPDTGAHPDADDDAPIGVRAMPAVRAVAADLHRSQTAPRGRELSTFDLWAIRFFGSIAAICFISLLVMVLRVFV
jgi:hypothetical protein